ncbi:MAG: hypothetical protein U9R40_05055 [Synergistota bacterium]|nr:hypothetical protein [Synergistota bacterium]
MNITVGSLALFFKTETPGVLRSSEERLNLFQAFAGPGPVSGLRPGPHVRARAGYDGMLVCAWEPEAYSFLLLVAAEQHGRMLQTPAGGYCLAKVVSDSAAHPWVKTVELAPRIRSLPLTGPVTLFTWTPLMLPADVIKNLKTAQNHLEKYGSTDPVLRQTDHWRILSLSIKPDRLVDTARRGKITLTSPHPVAEHIMQLAIVRGFGRRTESGYGHLDLHPDKYRGENR